MKKILFVLLTLGLTLPFYGADHFLPFPSSDFQRRDEDATSRPPIQPLTINSFKKALKASDTTKANRCLSRLPISQTNKAMLELFLREETKDTVLGFIQNIRLNSYKELFHAPYEDYDPELGYNPLPLLHFLILNSKENNCSELVEALLSRKDANVNGLDSSGNTPLHYAAENNTEEIIEKLIQKGAKVNARNLKGQTPSVLTKSSDARALLIRHGAFIFSPCSKVEITAYSKRTLWQKIKSFGALFRDSAMLRMPGQLIDFQNVNHNTLLSRLLLAGIHIPLGIVSLCMPKRLPFKYVALSAGLTTFYNFWLKSFLTIRT